MDIKGGLMKHIFSHMILAQNGIDRNALEQRVFTHVVIIRQIVVPYQVVYYNALFLLPVRRLSLFYTG